MMIIGLVTKMITTTMIGGKYVVIWKLDESLYLSFGMYVLLLFGDGGVGVLANVFKLV